MPPPNNIRDARVITQIPGEGCCYAQIGHFQNNKGLIKIMLHDTREDKTPWNFKDVPKINFKQLQKSGKSANTGE